MQPTLIFWDKGILFVVLYLRNLVKSLISELDG